jgi:hypothetical protein
VAAPLNKQTATSVKSLKVATGFQGELLSVPKAEQESWGNMCVTMKSHLIVSAPYGSLNRVGPPEILAAREMSVGKFNGDIPEAQGLLWAFDTLYVSRKFSAAEFRNHPARGVPAVTW